MLVLIGFVLIVGSRTTPGLIGGGAIIAIGAVVFLVRGDDEAV